MCGIAGIVRFDSEAIDAARVRAMREHLRHRGPDGDGTYEGGRCALIHTRLSVLDIAGGAQPMATPGDDGRLPLVVVFNGEIYNHRELRRELQSLGHAFRSDHSDTEVLLHGYHQWGRELPRRLSGMFAFAVWDVAEQSLFLARDRVGKKPLYLRRSRGELAFGSMVATLVTGNASGRKPEVDRPALLAFMRWGYPGVSAMVRGVEELPPASWLHVNRHGVEQTAVYWSPPERRSPERSRSVMSAGELLERARDAISQEVAARIEADVPLGCFLSGGIDSTIVAAMAQAALAKQGAGPLRTFSVAMTHAAYDESAIAAETARHIGATHTKLTAGPTRGGGALLDDLRLLTAVSGEPMADSSILPTYWLSRAAREHVTVALSGDGGDELFGGYDRYRAMTMLARHRKWIASIPRGLLRGDDPKSRRARLARLVAAAQQRTPASRYGSMIHLFLDHQIDELIPGLRDTRDDTAPTVPGWPASGHADDAEAAMTWDFHHYLPQNLLRKVDRASMAVALEVRCPLLGRAVCDLALSLRRGDVMTGGKPKGLLRALAAQLAPPSVATLPKRGFAIPIGHWLRGELRQPARALLLDGALNDLRVNRAAVERLWTEHVEQGRDHTHRLFALVSLALWGEWLRDPRPSRVTR